MAAPVVLYVDDHNPLISYTPNSSWIRGGNVFDYERTSTVSSTPGISASITFSGRRKLPFFQTLLCSDIFSIIGRPKTQALAYLEGSNASALVYQNLCCCPIASTMDPQQPTTLLNSLHTNSSKISSNLAP